MTEPIITNSELREMLKKATPGRWAVVDQMAGGPAIVESEHGTTVMQGRGMGGMQYRDLVPISHADAFCTIGLHNEATRLLDDSDEVRRLRTALVDVRNWFESHDYDPEEQFDDSDTVEALKGA